MWLHHQLLLLELDETSGKSLIADSLLQSHTFAGAVVAELQYRDRLVPVKAGQFAIRENLEPLGGSLGTAEARLAGRRPQTIGNCLGLVMGWGYNKLRREALDELVAMGALREEADTWWVITWRTRWPEADSQIERTIREHLGWWVEHVGPEDPPSKEDLLLSLMRVSKLLPWDLSDPAPGTIEERVLERTKRAPIGKAVKEKVDQTRAAIAAAAAAGT